MKSGHIAFVVLLFSVIAIVCFVKAASLMSRESSLDPRHGPVTPTAVGITSANVPDASEIGYVGTTGNATPDAPRLHFTILKLARGGRLWSGETLNPYPFLVESKP